mmetsp:Transcript_281/g.706  ORF Transcript_281/g.706 Transcript_281/m.706 type:complete len:223 (+) Transcript_281:2507-3175(+)
MYSVAFNNCDRPSLRKGSHTGFQASARVVASCSGIAPIHPASSSSWFSSTSRFTAECSLAPCAALAVSSTTEPPAVVSKRPSISLRTDRLEAVAGSCTERRGIRKGNNGARAVPIGTRCSGTSFPVFSDTESKRESRDAIARNVKNRSSLATRARLICGHSINAVQLTASAAIAPDNVSGAAICSQIVSRLLKYPHLSKFVDASRSTHKRICKRKPMSSALP